MNRRRQERGGGVVDDLFDGGNLFSVRDPFQKEQLRLDQLDKPIKIGILELLEKLFCHMVSVASSRENADPRTDDIVAVLVPDQGLQRAFALFIRRRQRVGDLLSLVRGAELDALLHHVAGELVFGQVQQVAGDQSDDLGPVLGVSMLNHVLSDIVAVLIDDERRRAPVQLLQHGRPGRLFAMFKHALDDAAAVRVRRQRMDLPRERVDDEPNVLRRYPFDGFLDHVVPVLVFDALEHVLFELLDQLRLLIDQDVLESLIESEPGRRTRPTTGERTFCTTRHPYIWSDSFSMWVFIWFASIFFWPWLPCSKNF